MKVQLYQSCYHDPDLVRISVSTTLEVNRYTANYASNPHNYTDAETTGGGLPGWAGNIAGTLRSNATDYKEGMPQL